jgi:thymidine phosphorylase
MLAAQGADLKKFDRMMESRGSLAAYVVDVPSPADGYVAQCAARRLGELAATLAASAAAQDAGQEFLVGIDRLLKPGTQVELGQPVARLHAPTKQLADESRQAILSAFSFSSEPVRQQPRVCSILHG